MQFDFMTAGRILFGSGSLDTGLNSAGQFGKKAFVVTGKSSRRTETLFIRLNKCDIEFENWAIYGEPDIQSISRGVEAARNGKCDYVIAFGGGAVLDAGKAIAAMVSNPGKILDYLEVVGNGKPIITPPLPIIAIPTTSGTGSEVTRNAVISVPENGVKVSLRHSMMLPRLAVIDPELTISLPADITAFSGMDALTQVIEPYVSVKANPMTDQFCREGICRAAKWLEKAYTDGNNIEAREGMAFASLMGGLALANAGLGAVHGLAGVIGGRFNAPHGAVCAALIAEVFKMNIVALQQRYPESTIISRYREISRILTGDPSADVDLGYWWLIDLALRMKIPRLGTYGVNRQAFPEIAQQAKASSSMKGNPIELTQLELEQILECSM